MYRQFGSTLVALLNVVLLAQTACAPAAAPSPTATAIPAAKPAATSAPALLPTSTPAAKPAAGADWKAEWEKTVAAAKKEGKVVVAGGPGGAYREVAVAFQKAYPEISVEFSGSTGPNFGAQVTAERDGGQYLWDVFVHGSTTLITVLKPKGALDPLRPALVLPEVVDDSRWIGGFDDGWMDKEHQFIIDFEARLMFSAFVNRDMVPESELNSIDQLVDPKWKGKIVSGDPREAGAVSPRTGHLLLVKGEDWLRKLLTQDLVVMKDGRMVAESLVRGRYPVGFGVAETDLVLLNQQGVGQNVKPVAPDTQAGATVTNGYGNVSLANKAPHPNAARVYVNWLLTREGQKAYVEATSLNSRRVDVDGPPDYALRRDIKYTNLNKEELLPSKQRAIDIAKEIIR